VRSVGRLSSATSSGDFGSRSVRRGVGSVCVVGDVVNACLSRKRCDDLARSLLRYVRTALPPVDGGERHPKPIGELLLGQVEFSTDGPEQLGWGPIFCHICHICHITAIRTTTL